MASGESFGVQVKRARERRHLIQQELADLLGVDRKTVDNWEHDRTFPRNRMGALMAWAPELAGDVDPKEAEYQAALRGLVGRDVLTEAEAAEALAWFQGLRRRARHNGAAERAG